MMAVAPRFLMRPPCGLRGTSLRAQTFVDYGRTKSLLGVSARDFVILTHYRVLPDGRIAAFATSTKHPACPEEKGVYVCVTPSSCASPGIAMQCACACVYPLTSCGW